MALWPPLHPEPPAMPPISRRVWAALCGITLAGAALRLYGLASRSLWYDEGASLYLRRYVDLSGSLFVADNTNEAPMMAVLSWLWYGVIIQGLTDLPPTAWQSDFLIRLLPFALGVLSIPLVFLVARRVALDNTAGIIAAILLATSPFFIHYAQELRIYAFVVPVALAAVYCMLQALDTNKLRYWAGFIAAEAVLMYSHLFQMWTIFFLSVFFVLSFRAYGRRLVGWTAWHALMMVLITPALIIAWHMNEIVQGIIFQWYGKPTWKTGLITFKNLMAGYGPTVWAYWTVFALALGFWGLGLVALARRRWPMAVLVAVMSTGPVVASIILWSQQQFSFYEHRLFIVSGLVALFGISAGLRALPGRVCWAALAVYLAAITPMLRDYYQDRLHPIEAHRWAIYDKVDFRSAAKHIQEQLEPGDLVVYPSHFMVYAMKHYLDAPQVRLGIGPEARLLFIQLFGNEPLLTAHGLMPVEKEIATADARRLWYVESHGITFEWKPETEPIRAWLDTHWHKADVRSFKGLSVVLYDARTSGAAAPDTQPEE